MKKWNYKVVKSQRGMDGKWFRYPAAATFEHFSDAEQYATEFAASQAGVSGTRINVLTRGGVSVAEHRV